ncbi:MAG: MFS transporter [Bosea sp. (in: a-proteobacteria)]
MLLRDGSCVREMMPEAGKHGGSPRAVAARLSLLQGLNFLGVGIYLPFFPLWLANKGLDEVAIGYLLTIPILVRIVAASWLTGLGDRSISPVTLLTLLNGIASLSYLALLPAERAPMIGLIMALNAVALSGVLPLADMLTTAQTRAGAGIDYGRVRLWGSVSFFAATLGGGWLIAGFGAGVVPVALSVSSALAMLAAFAAPAPPDERRAPAGAGAGRFCRAFWWALAAAACINAAHAALYAFGSLHWRDRGFGEPAIGALWGVGVFAEIALFLYLGGLVARGARAGLSWMALGGAAAILRFSTMALDPGYGVTLMLQMLHGLSFGAVHLGSMAAIAALAPAGRRGAAQGRLAAVGALASAAMTVVSGYIYRAHGELAFLAMIPLAITGLCCVALAKRDLPGDREIRGGPGSNGQAPRASRETGPAGAKDLD